MSLHVTLDLAPLREPLLAAFVSLATLPATHEPLGTLLLHRLDVVVSNVSMESLCVCKHPPARFSAFVVAPETSVCPMGHLKCAA